MKLEWLRDKTTIEAAEGEHAVTDASLGPEPVPFGFQNDAWERFKAKMQDGDELWTFRSPKSTWQHMAGRQGVALVRGGRIVAYVVTQMN